MNYFLFGLQRSGTNYMEQLIQRNYHGRRMNRQTRSWKHSIDIPEGFQPKVPTLIMYKNPYTWVESLCFRNNVDWIKSQKTYPIVEGDKNLAAGKNAFNVVQLAKTYRHWHNTWTQSETELGYILQYEDLLQPEKRDKHLLTFGNKFTTKRPSNWIIPPRGKISQSRDYSEDREKYYLEMKPTKLSPKHVNAITKTIGSDLILKIGYTPL